MLRPFDGGDRNFFATYTQTLPICHKFSSPQKLGKKTSQTFPLHSLCIRFYRAKKKSQTTNDKIKKIDCCWQNKGEKFSAHFHFFSSCSFRFSFYSCVSSWNKTGFVFFDLSSETRTDFDGNCFPKPWSVDCLHSGGRQLWDFLHVTYQFENFIYKLKKFSFKIKITTKPCSQLCKIVCSQA